MKTIFTKIGKLLLVSLVIFSMSFSQLNSVNAWDDKVPHEFTRIKNIKYPEWWGRKISGLSSWSTYSTMYNGKWAYCLESSKNSPQNGQYPAEVIENNEAVRKLLYYGFGGPAAWGQFANGYNLKEAICPDDDYLTNDDVKYLLTHIFLSGAYSNDWNGFSEELFNKAFGGSYGTNIMNMYRDILNLPEPGNGVSWSGNTVGKTAIFNAEFDKETKTQKTNTVTFNGTNLAVINIPLQDNVTIHITKTGFVQTGGIATVHGGESFYFTAPCKNSPSNYQSGNVCGSGCEMFTALAIKTGVEGDQTEGTWMWDPDGTVLYLDINWINLGKIEIKKTNTNTDLIDDAVFNLKSISFDGYSEDIIVTNGKLLVEYLPVGTYELKEIQAPEGYLLNETIYTLTVNKDQTTTQVVVNEEPRGEINLTKEINTDKTDGKLGDAYLQGNEYTLKAKEKITNKTGTVTYFERDDVIDIQTTDEQGKLKFDDLHIGKYYIEESKSNETLVLNSDDIDVSIDYEGQIVSKILRSTNTDNRVNMQKIKIFKAGEKDAESGIVVGLANAEFTFKLKSEVDKIGWDNSIIYDVITTDQNGQAHTKYLPYGEYIVRETKTPQDYITAPDFIVSVTKDYSEYIDVEQIKIININNRPATAQLKLVKKDLDSNKVVTLNSATFKVKAREDIVSNGRIIYKAGEVIKQKIGGKIYDSFTTSADNIVVPSGSFNNDGDIGSVMLPLQLDVGKYYIDEIKTPTGYLSLDKPIDFIIENIRDYNKDKDGDPILEVVIKNDKPEGQLKVVKSIESNIVDKSFIKNNDLSKIKFRLTAKENILDMADGTIIYGKNAIVGEYNLSKDGKLTVSDLPMGIYELQEISTLEGLVHNGIKYEIKFIQTDLTTKVYTVTQNIVNKPTMIEISKTSVTGTKELEGAFMQLLDSNRNVVCEWISGKKPYVVEGLEIGKTYILKEDFAPLGYVQAKEISFVIENTSEIQKVRMVDKVVGVKKIDIYGKVVDGALLQVVSTKTKNIVDQWVVDESENHNVEGLIAGETYILKELQAPDGYVLADDIEFIVEDDKQDQEIMMVDEFTKVEISKIDIINSKELPGARLLLEDISTGENIFIERWVSGNQPHMFEGLIVGHKYRLSEEAAPKGYQIAQAIEFIVEDTNKVQRIEMRDELLPIQPQTSDEKNIDSIISMFWISGIVMLGMGYVFLRKKECK
ncbi:SpaA isopeptide-forming pilin-related protein [Thomasclavelia cocleata]|uniref:SpaA isopeptide-forming pilin-related protein n=1 Tax=Thomasclavelia cocleata TaxID=69824 RepID=UPI00242ED862|nr:SpaA isopeptide-forming pilin-related protein [Thomasclavelia cocleata]